MVNTTPHSLNSQARELVPIVQETGWSPGPVWTDVEILAATRIQSSDHPTHSKLIHELHYPSPQTWMKNMKIDILELDCEDGF